jgi:alkylated DNA repair protein alkB family protein 8
MDEINQQTYEDIAAEFSATRAYVWKCMKDFTAMLPSDPPGSLTVLEIGCGNGKNMEYLIESGKGSVCGIDTCTNFIEICKAKQLNVCLANSTRLPFSDGSFDAMICIAMFHHLLTDEDRNQTMAEILRVLKPGSLGLITCWATDQPENSKFKFSEGVNIVPWKGKAGVSKIRYYYVYSKDMFISYFKSFAGIQILDIYNEAGNWILIFRLNFRKV